MVGVKKINNRTSSHCPDRFDQEEKTLTRDGEFSWTNKEQQLVMGAYYWGYTAAMIPAAWVSTKIGFR